MFNESLKKLWGFHPLQEAYFNTLKEANPFLVPARVVLSSHEQYKILIPGLDGERLAKVRGHYHHQGEELPVVGDWVVIEFSPGDHQNLPIEATLPRVSSLRRRDSQRGYQTLVANVDIVGLVTSFNQDLNERRLERGLVMIEEGGAKPIIIINKSDLTNEDTVEQGLAQLSQRFSNVIIVPCSARTGQGIDKVTALFSQGQTIAFLGMSGVGKSSLINTILGENRLVTKEIRLEDDRGRHGTTHRELVLTKGEFWIIDSPGIREFSSFGEEQVLELAFEDIASKMLNCRFSDCSHNKEPGCKIIEALDAGELSLDRWENYLKIKREMEFHANKHNKAFHSQKRKSHAKMTAYYRQKLKSKGRK